MKYKYKNSFEFTCIYLIFFFLRDIKSKIRINNMKLKKNVNQFSERKNNINVHKALNYYK